MSHATFGLALVAFMAVIIIAADTLLKIAADADRSAVSPMVMSGIALYAVSALLWLFVMRHMTLVQAGVAYSVISLLALAAIGVFWFGEKLHLREIAGIGCAIAAMLLMMRFT